ncbi:MAG: CRTAC1 family protein [Acidobacteriota bacterium]
MKRLVFASMALVASILAAQGIKPKASPSQPAPGVRFTDVTATAGIRFVHESGRMGKKYLPETLGAGVAFFDADGDGWLDLYFANGRKWTKGKGGKPALPALYLNRKDGTFRDATKGSGLDIELYGMGVSAGDYDNDGRDDLYVTALEGDRLFHNEGGGKFKNATAGSGIKNATFGTSSAWLDYDKDGKLDLFVANYVQWTAEKDLRCSLDGTSKSYCTPESYKGSASKLFHNLGGGKFEDASAKAGIADPNSKALGVAVLDFDGDGWSDLFVANDTQPNKLYKNRGNGTFVDQGLEAGVAFAEDGTARGAMGVDAADYDRSGRPHLLVGNFSNEMLSLYHNEGNGLFIDQAPASAVGRASLLTLTFGVFFFDFDLDGLSDIFAANGHIEEEIARVQPKVTYRQPPLLFRSLGSGRFEPVGGSMGKDFNRPIVARGAAYGDFDHDGDLDVAISTNAGPAYLFKNDGGAKNHWLRVRTVGTRSNRDGIGTVVKVTTASGTQWQTVHSGSSYCSQSELALTFGLGNDVKVKSIELTWPSGTKQKLTDVAMNREIVIDETKGNVGR